MESEPVDLDFFSKPDHPSGKFPFYKRFTVASIAYPATPQTTLPWPAQNIVLVNKGTNDTVFFSFDGQTDHGELGRVGVEPLPALKLRTQDIQQSCQNIALRVWFRTEGGGSLSVYIVAEP